MFQTAFTLAITQFARTLSFPERLQRSAMRNLALEGFRQRNIALDALFYDVKVITPDEAFYISDSLAAEGAILIVPPSGGAPLTLCDHPEEFMLRGGRDVRAIAVAGIGGSALGAAAFARNVADAIGGPASVVVSGYGLADIVTESLGGHFLFGHLRGLRPALEIFDDFAGRPKIGRPARSVAPDTSRTCLDTQTLRALLADPRLEPDLLVGHSKGCLVLSAALHDLVATDADRASNLAERAAIVTFGSRIAMPPAFADVTDIIGDWDWFGEMNSRHFIAADTRVPDAGHHTNTDLPNHLPVTPLLQEMLASRRMGTDGNDNQQAAPAETARHTAANGSKRAARPPTSAPAETRSAPAPVAALPSLPSSPSQTAKPH